MTTEDLQLSWLHCNICHRAFDGHNQVNLSGETIVLAHSDLYFYFTGCGHFFCENCLKDGSKGFNGGNKIPCQCRICGEQSQAFKIHSTIPDKVAMYLKPPISLLEDSLSIMMFQLNNSNRLITALRAKISSQKDLLTRAKQEISQVKDLKEIKILEEERRPFNPANSVQIDPNESYRIPIEFHHPHPQHRNLNPNPSNIPQQPTRNNNRNYTVNVPYSPFMNNRTPSNPNPYNRGQSTFIPPPDSPLIHVPGRLSLKSPSISNNNNYNGSYNVMNSPYPLTNGRLKVPRRVTSDHKTARNK